ncbi:MAG: ATP-dependent Clp protease ATP-binding subunit ClpC, partial [Niameybacter sp.]
EKKNYDEMKKSVMDELKHVFRPEFLNRIDETLVFHSLTNEHIKEIAHIMIRDLTNRITKNVGIQIKLTQEALNFLAEKGYSKAYGARPLKRTIQTYIEDKLADEILGGQLREGDEVQVDFESDTIVLKKQ